jgi:hypothetical protein
MKLINPKYLLFADGLEIYRVMNSRTDILLLWSDIEYIHEWF